MAMLPKSCKWKGICMFFNIRNVSSYKPALQKRLKIKNNFAFSKLLETHPNKVQYEDLNRKTIVSAELMTMKLKTIRKSSKSTLSYRGEILFGVHPVQLALLERKRHVFQLFIRRELEKTSDFGPESAKYEIEKLASSLGIPINIVDNKGLNYLAPGAVHQGVCLDAGSLPLSTYNTSEVENFEVPPLWIVLDEILDPMNVGAIIRSAYYFGIQKLFVLTSNSCKLSPTVSKASSGALEVVDLYQIENLDAFIMIMKQKGWAVISTATYCDSRVESCELPIVDAANFIMSVPTILILGNESRGISLSTQKLCDSFITIHPKHHLRKGMDSLNVSVAAGVIFHSLTTLKK